LGGGAFIVYNKKIYFSNFSDQRLYCQDITPGSKPVALTPEDKKWRYADANMSLDGKFMVCVREDHDVLKDGAKEALNTIVSIDMETQKQSILVCMGGLYFELGFLYQY
jgi:outer membrane protein assembly factor BamB